VQYPAWDNMKCFITCTLT